MVLLGRAVVQLEGLALRAYPDYRIVDDILPVAVRLALRASSSDADDAARSALLYELLYDGVDEGGGSQGEAALSATRLRTLLETARRSSAAALRTSSAGGLTARELLEELIQVRAVTEEGGYSTDRMWSDDAYHGVSMVCVWCA